jgi:hypothetical protein
MEKGNAVPVFTPVIVFAGLLALAPYLAAAFFASRVQGCARRLPVTAQVVLPGLLCAPYLIVALTAGSFRWEWLAVYAALPMGIAALMVVRNRLPERWWNDGIEFLIVAALGLVVDLRWLEGAWPAHLSAFNKILLVDAGIYGFMAIRHLEGVGFDLRLRGRDVAVGLREFVFYLPLALALGLGLGFLHWHGVGVGFGTVALRFAGAWVFTFFLIAVPEELFFRGWLQNLLERHIGYRGALITASILFGLAHFNKRAVHFNWRYVWMAAIAGFFYGRAWRQDRRVGASAVTHATVDAVWSLWLR